MLAVLRRCGALAVLLPEVDALFGVPQPPRHHPEVDAGVHVARALDWSAAHALSLPARYAVLAHDLGKGTTRAGELPRHIAHERRGVRLAEAMSARLKVPVDCRDAARLAARWHGVVHRALELTPAKLLDLLLAADALRRPERLDDLLAACRADACSRPGPGGDYAPAAYLRDALAVVQRVNAGAVASQALSRHASKVARQDAQAARSPPPIAQAIRRARIGALREWKRGLQMR
jgi:tRNA nucleotidyltransferase (CCA-adding enzyme)